MPWLLPDEIRDFDNVWDEESTAGDDDVDTSAYLLVPPGPDWYGPLQFEFGSTLSTRLKIFWGTNSETTECLVRLLFWEEPWVEFVVQDIPERGWQYFLWPERQISAVRLHFRHSDAFDVDVDIAELALWSECVGPLAPLCQKLHDVADFWSGLAVAIQETFILGDTLYDPFRNVAHMFDDLGVRCCQASASLKEILDALEGGISWAELIAPLADDFPALYALLTDPVQFILDTVGGMVPELPDWLSDPLAWLTDMLEENFPLLYYLVIDPGGEILYLLGEAFDLTPWETQSPEFLLKAIIQRHLPELYALIYLEPGGLWGFLLSTYEGVFTAISDKVKGLAEHTIRYFWEGEW